MAGGHGPNFIADLVGNDYAKITTAALVAGGLLVLSLVGKRSLEKAENPLVPDKGLTVRNILELFVEFIVKLGDNVMGKENRKYLPFAGTFFIYIFTMNLLGLIPGFSMPTDDVKINVGLALVAFFAYNYWGIREVGVINYLKHFWGPVLVLGPFLMCVELISHMVRPLTLSLRLFGNMTGDHMALMLFTELTKATPIFWVPLVFYIMGTLVSLIQAFIFSLLTMIYIRLAVAHDDDH